MMKQLNGLIFIIIVTSAAILTCAVPIAHTQSPTALDASVQNSHHLNRLTDVDTSHAAPLVQSEIETIDQQELKTRAGFDLFEFGRKALNDASSVGRGSLPGGTTGTNVDASRASHLTNLDPEHHQLHLAHVPQATTRTPARLFNVVQNTQQPTPVATAGPLGTTYVQTSPYELHWFLPEHLASQLRPQSIANIHRIFHLHMLQRMAQSPRAVPVQANLHLHVQRNPQRMHVQARTQSQPSRAIPRLDAVQASSSPPAFSTLTLPRMRTDRGSTQAGPSNVDAREKGKGIMTEASKSRKHKEALKPLQTRPMPWFNAFSSVLPRAGGGARPSTVPFLDRDVDTELRLATPDTELRLSPVTPAKPSERRVSEPEQNGWLTKEDLAPPNAKKQRQG